MEYKEYRKFFKNLCCLFKKKFPGLSIEQIEDIICDVVLITLQSSCRQNQNFSFPLFYKQIYNKSLDKLRYLAKISNKRFQIDDYEFVFNFNPDFEYTLDSEILVREIYSKLSNVDKHIFLLLFQGYKQNEIANELNISVSAAQKRVQRLRKKLIEIYKSIL